ncbi:hypothetical protein [Hymenobacter sp. B81]|uniref:hypothetical protein n=1 Tax=Hymenobacter sp. B81 TaxID=3344878 RepID=UPI0037DDBF95
MKKRPLILRLFSLWLALLVLTSSVGLAVQQHTCRASGQTQRAVVLTPRHTCAPQPRQPADCNSPAAPQFKGATVQDGCCAFSVDHHHVDAPSAQLKLAQAPVPVWVATLPSLGWPALAPALATVSAAEVLYGADASPPPRAGRTLLTFVCTLVV